MALSSTSSGATSLTLARESRRPDHREVRPPRSLLFPIAELTSSPFSLSRSCGTKNVFRSVPTYMDAAARANMSEFHPVDEIDSALSVEGVGLEVVS